MPNIQTNMPSIHSNVPSIHSNVPSVHSNMPSVHSNMPNIHDVAARSNIPTCQTCTTSPLARSDIPTCQTFIPTCQTFIPACQTFIPTCQTFIPTCQTFIPTCQAFIHDIAARTSLSCGVVVVVCTGQRSAQSISPSVGSADDCQRYTDTPQRTNERTHERTNERTNERTERVSSSVARATCRPCLLTYFTWTTCFPSLSSIYPGCRNGCRGVCGRMVRADVRIILREGGCRDGRNVVE